MPPPYAARLSPSGVGRCRAQQPSDGFTPACRLYPARASRPAVHTRRRSAARGLAGWPPCRLRQRGAGLGMSEQHWKRRHARFGPAGLRSLRVPFRTQYAIFLWACYYPARLCNLWACLAAKRQAAWAGSGQGCRAAAGGARRRRVGVLVLHSMETPRASVSAPHMFFIVPCSPTMLAGRAFPLRFPAARGSGIARATGSMPPYGENLEGNPNR
jgi:hypothetical protein